MDIFYSRDRYKCEKKRKKKDVVTSTKLWILDALGTDIRTRLMLSRLKPTLGKLM